MRLHHIMLAAVAILIAASAAVASDWDTEATRRKAAYIFLDALDDLNDERYTAYSSKLRRATALDPDDPDMAAEYAELLIETTRLDSAGAEAVYAALWRRFLHRPGDYTIASEVADVAQQMGKYADVARVWKELRRSLPGRNDPSMNLADTYVLMYMRGDTAAYDSAMTIYRSLEDGLGVDVGLSSHKVRALMLHGDTAAVVHELGRLAAAAPADADVALYSGQVFESLGMPDSALERYDRVCRIDSTDGRALMLRSKLHLSRGDSAAYDDEVFRALESPNLDFTNKMRMLSSYIRALFTDSTQHARIDRLFEVMRQVNPGEPDLYALCALYMSQTGRPDAAAEQAGYAVDLDPSNVELWTMLVQAEARRDSTARVIDVTRRGAALFPDNPYFPIVGAGQLLQDKRYDEAAAMLDSFDINPVQNSEVVGEYWTMRADIEYGAGRTDSASVLYERAIAIDPHNYLAMNNYAYHLAENDTLLDRAEHYASLAVKNRPESPTMLDTYAWVLFKKKEYSLARGYIDAALRICDGTASAKDSDSPDGDAQELQEDSEGASAEIYDHAGDIYFMNGERDTALEYWRRAAALDPENELIARKVALKTILFE
ncbi:MAG: tetratricopeptide repeat protein [Muribaculaceae bacterium]|nr:tetratricopeptide repeat protein [Muribaculaceae bacterium]